MTKLTTEQLDHYKNKGYISPVNALSSIEAKEIRDEIEKIEKKWPKALEGINRNYVHLISQVLNKDCLNNFSNVSGIFMASTNLLYSLLAWSG